MPHLFWKDVSWYIVDNIDLEFRFCWKNTTTTQISRKAERIIFNQLADHCRKVPYQQSQYSHSKPVFLNLLEMPLKALYDSQQASLQLIDHKTGWNHSFSLKNSIFNIQWFNTKSSVKCNLEYCIIHIMQLYSCLTSKPLFFTERTGHLTFSDLTLNLALNVRAL